MSETETTTGVPPATDYAKFSAGESVVRTDTKGRKLEIKQLSLLEEMGLLAVAGARADNRIWMRYATWVCCVRAIDGFPYVLPINERLLTAHITRVDSPGVAAVLLMLSEGVPAESADGEEEPVVEASAAETAKN